MTAFISWSGGKDSALALYKALENGNINVSHCLNMITDDGKHTRSHGVLSEILRAQTGAMGMQILQPPTTWDNYEEKFKKGVCTLKKEGIDTGIFGDIDLEAHRQWVERVCRELGITPVLPLWQGNREQLIWEFIDIGFKAVVTAVNSKYLGQEWLGRMIDDTFVADLKKRESIDLCGENGEYHTLVLNGPFFNKRIDILATERIKVENHWFLNITDYKLEPRA
jgi:diphthine-ammonia ligase